MSQIVEKAPSRYVEKSFQKIPDHDPEADDFQNLTSSVQSLIRLWKNFHEDLTTSFYVKLLTDGRVVVSVSTSRSRRLGLETYQGLVLRKIVNLSISSRSRGGRRLGLVSAIYVSCPIPIFVQIVQATVRSVNGLYTL